MAPPEDWIIWMKQELANPSSFESLPSPCISRVPAPLRSVRPAAFTPQTVAIGPYHRKLLHEGEGCYSFTEMERYKLMAAKAVAQMFQSPATFALLVEDVVREEVKVRASFDTGLGLEDLNQEQLGYMFAVDAAFVVAILQSMCNDLATDSARCQKAKHCLLSNFFPVFSRNFSHPMRKAVELDFLLFENQIPLFLLKKVIRMDKRHASSAHNADAELEAFIEALACRALPFGSSTHCISEGFQKLGAVEGKHLLDCMYRIATLGNPDSIDELDTNPVALPTATRLRKAGVRFKSHDRSLSEVSFKGSTLKLPSIRVDDGTERLFRNLVAYESHTTVRADVVSYLHFMNFLINTAEDVCILADAGIVVQTIGDNTQVAKMWNELAKNTACVFTKQYSEVSRLAKHYVDLQIHGVLAEFTERYFSRPWLVVSLLSGLSLLLMTFLTMFYTILLYKKG